MFTRHFSRDVMSTVVFYISGHGFGHASRQTQVIRALLRKHPETKVVVKTSVPKWFFANSGLKGLEIDPIQTDTGVAQTDSLHIDVNQSIKRADTFHQSIGYLAETEAVDLRTRRAALVVGDIPPLACLAGASASIPTVAIGNFTWDWIYASYKETQEHAPDLVAKLASAYETATVGWRLPLHGGFGSIRTVVNVPMIARRSSQQPEAIRKELNLPNNRKLVLLAFGRYGVGKIDWKQVEQLFGYHVLATADGHSSPEAGNRVSTRFTERSLALKGFNYTDLVAAVDIVITKPGFGMVSECAANDTAMLYTDRGRFPEYNVLTAGMPSLIRSKHIDQNTLFSGQWQPHLDNLLAQPRPKPPNLNGAETIADKLADILE